MTDEKLREMAWMPEWLDRSNLFLNHGRAKHSDSCWRCDEPWPCLTIRVVIDADHDDALWADGAPWLRDEILDRLEVPRG